MRGERERDRRIMLSVESVTGSERVVFSCMADIVASSAARSSGVRSAVRQEDVRCDRLR